MCAVFSIFAANSFDMKKFLLVSVFFFSLCFTFNLGFGQNQVDPCEAEDTQLNLNLCSRQKYKKADAKLNATWKELLKDMSDEAKAEIRVVQKAWLKFRDAHCNYEASFYEGGSIQPLIFNNCMRDLTEQRTKQLQDQIDNIH